MGRSLSGGEAEKGVGGRGNGTDKAREAWRVSRHVREWCDKAGRSMGSTWWEMRLGSQVEAQLGKAWGLGEEAGALSCKDRGPPSCLWAGKANRARLCLVSFLKALRQPLLARVSPARSH